VVVSATVNVSVAVGSDTSGLGVDWNLICGGSAVPGFTLNVCGTINPVYVGSNINMIYTAPQYIPVGNTVTLTAASTSDPSRSVSVTLTILPKPVTIQFTQRYFPPTSMGATITAPDGTVVANSTAQIGAITTNDNAAGVKWSVTCGSASCGLFSEATTSGNGAATTYTAPSAIPAGGTVTVTATSINDTTKSVSATIAIMPIAVTLSAPSQSVPVGTTDQITATVAFDASNQGVNWSNPTCASPGQCGSIASMQTVSGAAVVYTAPDLVPSGSVVTVTASSVADPTKSATLAITVMPPPPISVKVTPPSTIVQVGGQAALTAILTNDYTNSGRGSGVTWQCPPNGCIPSSSTYPPLVTQYLAPGTIPASNPVSVTATSIADPTKDGAASVTVVPAISVVLNLPQGITAGVPATFSATVTNDIAPGGVDWTASGCPTTSCGSFNSGDPNAPNHSASGANITYTLPNNIPWATATPTITITATSTASLTAPPTQSSSTAESVTPVTYVQFVPFAPTSLPVGDPTASLPTLINLIAAATNDPTNQGVDWTVSCSDASPAACGQFLKTPELVANALTSKPDIPAVFWPYGAKVHVASGEEVVYEPPTRIPTGGTVTVTATSTAQPSTAASQAITITSNLSGTALSGSVQVGKLPVSRATVQLLVAGSTGYGSAAQPLVISNGGTSVTTGNDGSFSISAGYTCPSLNSLVYLAALGGAPGAQGQVNPQLGLITALGPCGNLNASAPIIVNEVTTVASLFALAPFTGADYQHIGSSSVNYSNGPNTSNATNYNNGLAHAFSTVNNLADITTGQAWAITPAGNGTVPQAEINTLADAVNTCAATSGGVPGDGSACDAFFEASNVNPPGGVAPTIANAPTSIPQAVIEVAQVPSTQKLTTQISGTLLYDLVTNPSPPFTPTLTGPPFDWSIALSFTGGGLDGVSPHPIAASMAIDASGAIWLSNRNTSTVTELSHLGAALSPWATSTTAGGFTGAGISSPQKVAIDPFGNLWVLNLNSSLSVLDSTGTPLGAPGNPFSGAGNPADAARGMAIDGTGNVWVAEGGSPGDVAEYAGYNAQVVLGTPLSPQGVGYAGANSGINNPNGGIAVDGSGEVWILNQGNFSAVPLGVSNGLWLDPGNPDRGDLIDSNSGSPFNPPHYMLGSTAFGATLAIDDAGDLFIPASSSATGTIYELLAGGSSANFGGVGQAISTATAPLYAPLAIDGSGNLWLMIHSSFTPLGAQLPASLGQFKASGTALNSNGGAAGFVSSSVGTTGTGITTIAPDAAGNVWVLSGTSPTTLTEFVGVAGPTMTPTSVAVQKNKLGKAP
jgi:hypothetical protein